jgi:hypothetical protein
VDIAALQKTLSEFATERDWEQFHSPKNLAMALAGECGELAINAARYPVALSKGKATKYNRRE